MKHLLTLTFAIIFLIFLNACGGGSSDDSTTPSVDNLPPEANAGPDLNVYINQTITITGSGTDSDGTIVSYVWNDDSNNQLASTASFNYTPTSEGTKTLTLTVTDDDGETTSDSMILTVEVVPNIEVLPDASIHDVNFTTTHFSGSGKCAKCHNGITDSDGKDVSIAKAWHSTMMANAATDPLWKAKVATEVKEHPEFKEVIESKCSKCHTPMATVEATYIGDAVALLGDDGFLSHESFYYDAAMQGVSCTLCHQIEDTPQLGTTKGFSGGFVIDTNNTGTERKIYGPYMDPNPMPMQNNVQFTPEYSAHMNDSKHCATCHNLETPVIATDGTLTKDTFPEQAAYTEWEYSDFNGTQSCQDCHMPVVKSGELNATVIISTQGNNLTARSPFYQHKFLGANTYMLEIIKQNRSKIGPIADDGSFDTTITDARDFLLAAADVNITTTNFTDNTLEFSVKVTNHSGHKFPTGFPSRRVWLHVTVKNSTDKIVFESGALSDDGKIIGVDDTADYERHHQTIEDNNSVQVYETILSDTDNKMTYILLHALHYLKDNRLLPRGLDKTNVPENINPHGNAVNDSDFIGGSDTIKYKIANLPADDYTVTVSLHYQTLSFGFAQDLYKNAELPEVALMKALDASTTNRYETISMDTASVSVP